jgi:hypothetical protein
MAAVVWPAGFFLSICFYGYEKILTGIIGAVIRAVRKPDPVVDIGTRHIAYVVNVVEDNEIY